MGGNTLISREIQELVDDGKIPLRLELLDGEMTGGTLSVKEDEAVYLAPVTKQTLGEAKVVFLAGTPSSHEHSLAAARADARLIDLTGAMEEHPDAVLRAPLLEREPVSSSARVTVLAHPAAVAIGKLFRLLAVAGEIERSVVVAYEPASERGHAGIGELDKQTRNLLALQAMPQAVYDAQLAFNMLPEYGSEAPLKLADVESRIARHLDSLLGEQMPAPSFRLVQAPVFHGYSFSVWVEFREPVDAAQIARILKADQVDVRDGETAPASNVGTAQQSGLTVGSIRVDRNNRSAVWLWMVCDNLRLHGESALKIAREVMG